MPKEVNDLALILIEDTSFKLIEKPERIQNKYQLKLQEMSFEPLNPCKKQRV